MATLQPGEVMTTMTSSAYTSAGGNPFDKSDGCTWYAWGRAKEKCGIAIAFSRDSNRDPNLWCSLITNCLILDPSSIPRANSIASFSNHVAFIEGIDESNVYFTDAGAGHDGILQVKSLSAFQTLYGQTLIGYIVVASTTTPGWFRQGDGSFHLLRTNTAGAASVPFVAASTGSGIYPIAGDWQGTGTITPGWFRQSDGSFHLLKSNTAGADTIAFVGAPAGDANVLPLAGDWYGDGITRVGWYRRTDGTFHLLESNAAGSGTNAFVGGPVGDNSVYPLAGDWNGNGVTEVGWFRQSDGTFHLLPNNAPGTSTNAFTAAPTGSGIYPLAGDWTAEGFAKAGWFRQADGSYHLLKSNANNADTIPFVAAPTDDSGVYPLASAKGFWSI